MAEILLFQPKAELDAFENLQGFIDSCRTELTVFGADLPFDANVWDITNSINLKGYGNKRHRLIFSSLETVNDNLPSSMAEPFLSFAKAYMRYMQGFRPTVGIAATRLTALRALEGSLRKSFGDSNLVKADILTFNQAAQMIVDKYSATNAYRMGGQLEMLADFLSKNKLTTIPIRWRNFIKRPADTIRVGKDFDDRRKDRMPSQAALDALPEVYLKAVEPVDVIVSSVTAILCASPDRISELLSLPLECELRQKTGKTGIDAYGLRWWPAKGADPMVKWIVPSMVSVVQEAIAKIRKVTEESRRIAKWYEDNPTRIYLVAECEHLRKHEWLTMSELGNILGLSDRTSPIEWCKTHHLEGLKGSGIIYILFSDVEKAVIRMLPKNFPLMDKKTGLKYSESLFVVRRNELGAQRCTYNCMIESISINQINSSLGGRVSSGFASVFTKHGFVEPDGSDIKITTHQFRHYLNTLAQAGGLSQLDIAKWSGRKDIRQNAAYDHVTPGQMIQKIRDAVGGESVMFGPLAELSKKTLIPRDEFARLVVPTAHTTELGYCIHDYTMSPCQIHMDCINCTDLICVKGDLVKERRLRSQLDEAQSLMLKAEQANKEQYFGSDRWLDHHKNTVARLTELLSIMDDPKVPVGAVIQLSPPKSSVQKISTPKKLKKSAKVIGNSSIELEME
ncbi:integrase [Methylotenera sp.]|uniref:integrase n=1 Tax=Methylotenera sp. TaxID=2051956 RepID=UPI0027347B18|nr:integrase [Methylotenera sp.]MDP3307620.1 integrase [Methylotenera sp.]